MAQTLQLLQYSLPTFTAFTDNPVFQKEVEEFVRTVLEYNTEFEYSHKEDLPTKMSAFRDFLIAIDIKVLQECLRKYSDHSIKTGVPVCPITKIQINHIYSLKAIRENEAMVFPFHVDMFHVISNPTINQQITTYLDIYYEGLSPSECMDTIHHVLKSNSKVELLVILAYCDILRKNKYQTYKQLICSNMEYFLSLDFPTYYIYKAYGGSYILIMLHLLHKSLSSREIQNMRHLVNKIKLLKGGFNLRFLFDKILYMTDKDQVFSVPPVALLLQDEELFNRSVLQAIIVYYERLMMCESNENSIEFLKCYIQYLIDVDEETLNTVNCHTRQQYCVVLLRLLHHFDLLGEINGIELILNALQKMKFSLLKHVEDSNRCYCYRGSEKCNLDLNSQNEMVVNDHEQSYRDKKAAMSYKNYSINMFSTYKKIQHSINLDDQYIDMWHGNYDDRSCDDDDDDDDDRLCDDDRLWADMWLDGDDDDVWFKAYYSLGAIPAHKTELKFETLIEELVDKHGIIESVINVLSWFSQVKIIPKTEDFVISQLVNISKTKYKKSKLVQAQLVLDVNKDENANKSPLVDQLTLQLAKSLGLEETYANDKNKVIYKCYCIVRHAIKNENVKDIDIAGYKKYFTFIRTMENQEELEKQTSYTQVLILLLLLMLVSSSSGSHHKSAGLKKFLSLKYEYDDAILYLLWCSGDVEINPGPTFSKLEKLPNSQKERNWLYDICSVLGKLSVGIPEDQLSCKSEIWTRKPVGFPGGFSNPREKPTKLRHKFFHDLLNYCNNIKKVHIPDCYQREIDLFEGDKTLLLKLFISRQEISEITKAITSLSLYNGVQELQQCMAEMKIGISFSSIDPSSSVDKVDRSEITRDLAVTFCRICKGLKTTQKSDGIWKEPPQGWNPQHGYYSPHNAGKRTAKNPDRILVDNILQHIQTNHLPIPYKYRAIVQAWNNRNIDDLRKLYTIHLNTSSIEHSLRYLKLEDLLKDIQDKLKQIGLTVAPEWFDSDDASFATIKTGQASTTPVTKKTSSSVRVYSSCQQFSSSSTDDQHLQGEPACRPKKQACRQKKQSINSITFPKCLDNQLHSKNCPTVDLNALASYTGSSHGAIASGTSHPSSEFALESDNTVSLKKSKSRKRKVQDGKREKQNSGKKHITFTEAENFATQSTCISTSLTNPPNNQLPSNDSAPQSAAVNSNLDDIDNIFSLVEDLSRDYCLSHQTKQLTDKSLPGDLQIDQDLNTEGADLSFGQNSSTCTVMSHAVSTPLLSATNPVGLTDIDFLYADKMEDQTTVGLSSENDEEMKELDKQLPELNSLSKSLNWSTQEVFDTIAQFGLNDNSVSSQSKPSVTDPQDDENSEIENRIIDITEFGKCDAEI